MGERKLLERSFSFPHTPFLSRTLQRGIGLLYKKTLDLCVFKVERTVFEK